MKRYLRLAAWCLGLALAVTACGRAGRIVLPEAAEVTAIRVTAGDAVTLHTDRDWIGEFLQQAAEAVSTGMESVQDAPDQTGAVKVELGTGETPDWSVLYVYEADGICCPEELKGPRDLGWMLYDMDYTNPEDIRPLFFRASLEDGVLRVPGRNSREVRG